MDEITECSSEARTRPWYQDWFERKEYDLVYFKRNDTEAERLVDLIERVAQPAPESRILDVACGRGRHARLFARRGYRVTGTDLSRRALSIARETTAREGLDITFIRADMREQVQTGVFDGVVNLFTAFGYFDRATEHQQTIDAMAASIRPDGWLVQDFLNAAYVRNHLVPEDYRKEDGIEIIQQRWIENDRVNKTITVRKREEEYVFNESVHLFDVTDFNDMYERAGLRLEQVFGDYEGNAHTQDSPRLILYARREH